MKRMLLTLLAAFGLMVPTLRAQETAVAKIGDTEYTSLTKAFEAAQAMTRPFTITLLQDVDYTKEGVNKSVAVNLCQVTIDLGGHTVVTGYSTDNKPLLTLLGDFTLRNGTVRANGSYGIFTGNVSGAVDSGLVAKIESVKVLDGGINVGSKVELVDVTATGNDYYAVWSEGDVTIKSGTYSSNGNAVLGVSKNASGKMTIEGGTFIAKEDQPMVLSGYDKPLIKGGTFSKDMSTENATLDETLRWKDNGNGTWTTEEKPKPVAYIKKAFDEVEYRSIQAAIDAWTTEDVESYYYIVLAQDATEDVTVTAGKNIRLKTSGFLWRGAITNNGSVYFDSDGTANSLTWIDVTISCGEGATVEFSDLVYSPRKFEGDFVTGYTKWVYTDKEGWFVASSSVGAKIGERAYRDVQTAINAAEDGETVVLNGNSTLNENLVVAEGKTVTLNLNGKTLRNPSSAKGTPVITNNGTLTIVNTATTVGSITQRSSSTGELIANAGTLVIEGGKFTPVSGNGVVANTNGGTTTVKGGSFNRDISAVDGVTMSEDIAAKTLSGMTTTYYSTLQAAIDAAKKGDTVTVLKDCAEDIVLPLRSLTLTSEEGATKPVLAGKVDFAAGAMPEGTQVTIENLAFKNTRIMLIAWNTTTSLDKMGGLTIRNNTFSGTLGTSAEKNVYAIHINNGDVAVNNLTIAGNVFTDCGLGSGGCVYATVCGELVVTGNTFTNSAMNALTFTGKDTNGAHAITSATIANNTFNGWAHTYVSETTGLPEGRSMRLSNFVHDVDLTENSFVSEKLPEEYIKLTGLAEGKKANVDACYWGGEAPAADKLLGVSPVTTYYTDEEMTNLVRLPVAAIGDKTYATLQEAIEAAQPNDTVTLLMDVDLTDLPGGYNVFDISGVALDLNQKTITAGNNNSTDSGTNNGFVVFQGVDATIRNGKFAVTVGNYALFIGDEGETDGFVVEDVVTSGVNIFNAANVTLRKVTSAGKAYYSVWCDENGHVTIESGEHSSEGYAVLGLSATGATMSVMDGSFVAKDDQPMVLEGKYGKPQISGGTFSTRPDAVYCAEGFVTTPNADGTYGVVQGAWAAEVAGEQYATLREAVEAAVAAEPAQTVTLLRDVTLEGAVTLTADVSIDLAGHTLYAKDGETPAFTSETPVTVTFVKEGGEETAKGSLIAAAQKDATNVTIDGLEPLTIAKWTDEGAYDTSWYKEGQTAYMLTTAAQVAGIAAKILEREKEWAESFSAGEDPEPIDYFSGVTFTLGADIDLSSLEWVAKIFDGTLVGAGHAIKGIRVSGKGNQGFFSALRGTVESVRFTGASVTVAPSSGGQRYGGVVAGTLANGGGIRACVVESSTVSATGDATAEGLGGFVGSSAGTIENGLVSFVTFVGSDTANGFAGLWNGTIANSLDLSVEMSSLFSLNPGSNAKVENTYYKEDGRFYPMALADGSISFEEPLGEGAALNGVGWLLNGQSTEETTAWRVDSNEACTKLLPFAATGVAEIPAIETYLEVNASGKGFTNGHEATVALTADAQGTLVTELRAHRADYNVDETLTLKEPAIVSPGKRNGTAVETATLTIGAKAEAAVQIEKAKALTLKGSGTATPVSNKVTIASGSALTLEDSLTLTVPAGATLTVAGTVTVAETAKLVGADGSSVLEIVDEGSVTGLSAGIWTWDAQQSKWSQAQAKDANGHYYGSVQSALAALDAGDQVTLLARGAANASVRATTADKAFTGADAYDVADVLGGAFIVADDHSALVYAYDLGVGGLTIRTAAADEATGEIQEGDLVVEVTVKLAENGAAPAGTRTREGCTLTVTSILDEDETKKQTFTLTEGIAFTDGECKVTIPYTEETFPRGTSHLTVSLSKGGE